jgi:PAS domain S-box-containing protein
MRSYILTDWDRERIRRFLEEDEALDGFAVLKTRFWDSIPTLLEDIGLLVRLYHKIGGDAPAPINLLTEDMRLWMIEQFMQVIPEAASEVYDRATRHKDFRNWLLSVACEHSIEGVVITDMNQRILYVNNSFRRMTGKSKNHNIGDILPIREKILETLIKEGYYEDVFFTRDFGRPMWIYFEANVLHNEKKEPVAIAIFGIDVTGRRRLEDRLEDVITQLKELRPRSN